MSISAITYVYGVKEAAQLIGISERHLKLLLKREQVVGKKLGHDWVVLSLKCRRKRRPKRRAEQ